MHYRFSYFGVQIQFWLFSPTFFSKLEQLMIHKIFSCIKPRELLQLRKIRYRSISKYSFRDFLLVFESPLTFWFASLDPCIPFKVWSYGICLGPHTKKLTWQEIDLAFLTYYANSRILTSSFVIVCKSFLSALKVPPYHTVYRKSPVLLYLGSIMANLLALCNFAE